MLHIFGYISGFLSVICYIPYIRDIINRSTVPERATWFIFSALSLIMLTSQIAKGATDSLWLVGVQTVGVVVIFILSVIYGKGKLLRRDVVALVAAGVGVALWLVTKEALYALVISIVVDMIGALLTVVKAYERPESETMSTWFLSGAAGIFAALSIGSLDWVLLLFPLYVIAINYTVVGAMLLGKKIKAKRLHS